MCPAVLVTFTRPRIWFVLATCFFVSTVILLRPFLRSEFSRSSFSDDNKIARKDYASSSSIEQQIFNAKLRVIEKASQPMSQAKIHPQSAPLFLPHRTAYVVFIGSIDIILPARVLGLRLEKLDPSRARLMIIEDSVFESLQAFNHFSSGNDDIISILVGEGWRIQNVPRIINPWTSSNDVKATRVFSKLHIWNPILVTNFGFEKLVYLDTDVRPVTR